MLFPGPVCLRFLRRGNIIHSSNDNVEHLSLSIYGGVFVSVSDGNQVS